MLRDDSPMMKGPCLCFACLGRSRPTNCCRPDGKGIPTPRGCQERIRAVRRLNCLFDANAIDNQPSLPKGAAETEPYGP